MALLHYFSEIVVLTMPFVVLLQYDVIIRENGKRG